MYRELSFCPHSTFPSLTSSFLSIYFVFGLVFYFFSKGFCKTSFPQKSFFLHPSPFWFWNWLSLGLNRRYSQPSQARAFSCFYLSFLLYTIWNFMAIEINLRSFLAHWVTFWSWNFYWALPLGLGLGPTKISRQEYWISPWIWHIIMLPCILESFKVALFLYFPLFFGSFRVFCIWLGKIVC